MVVRIQEQALLSRGAGKAVVAGRFRFARVAVAVLASLMRVTRWSAGFRLIRILTLESVQPRLKCVESHYKTQLQKSCSGHR